MSGISKQNSLNTGGYRFHPFLKCVIFLFLGLAFSCGPKGKSSVRTNDSSVIPPTDSLAIIDTVPTHQDTLAKIDSTAKAVTVIKKKSGTKKSKRFPKDVVADIDHTITTTGSISSKQAVLGYSYFKKMKLGASKNINVFISIKFPASKLIDTLKSVNLDESDKTRNDTPSIGTEYFPDNFAAYDSVDVILSDPAKAFKIDTLAPTRQPVSGISRWTWAITALTQEEKATLIITAKPLRQDGSVKNIVPKNIIIEIEVKHNFLRKLWIYANDNPWAVVTVILIPLIAFFGRRIFKSDKS